MKKNSNNLSIAKYEPNIHDCSEFDCGNALLNSFLAKNAASYEKIGAAKTFVLLKDKKIVGFHAISAATVEAKSINIRWPKHPMPVVLLGRLAVDNQAHGKGFGRILVGDVFQKALAVSALIGCTAVVTDAKDEAASDFYRRCGFKSFKGNETKLFVSVKTIESLLI
jgi:predicted N-acetyltransferase YhbS